VGGRNSDMIRSFRHRGPSPKTLSDFELESEHFGTF